MHHPHCEHYPSVILIHQPLCYGLVLLIIHQFHQYCILSMEQSNSYIVPLTYCDVATVHAKPSVKYCYMTKL